MCVIAAAIAMDALAGGAGHDPQLLFSGNTVQVSGVTPGGGVVLYAATQRRIDYGNTLVRYTRYTKDDDHDGSVTFDLGERPSPIGVWVAIDANTGNFALGAPNHAVAVAHEQPQPFAKNDKGDVDTFTFTYPSLELVYIHPGRGVWSVHATDGGHFDHDKREAVTSVILTDAVSLIPDGEPHASAFSPGGTLVAFDVEQFQAFTLHVTGADLAGAK
jgi:hypothetical protein